MNYQKVVKGIAELPKSEAREIVHSKGIISNWWRLKGMIAEEEISTVLTDENLVHHLDNYDMPVSPAPADPALQSKTYGEISAFISTSAGAVQRDAMNQRNVLYSPFLTALEFATDSYSCDGFVFYAYLLTIGKPAVEMRQFSEEVRELHVYTGFRKYHHEGEIAAKINIPAIQIEKAEMYKGKRAHKDLTKNRRPSPEYILTNPNYVSPDRLSNVRELL